MTWQDSLRRGEEFLAGANIPDSSADAWYLLEYCAKIDRTWFLLNREKEIPQGVDQKYQELLKKRSLHIPLQHLTGEQEFMGLPFHVNENVLIPRQDTETLVEEVLKIVKPGDKILDLCTGSGYSEIARRKAGTWRLRRRGRIFRKKRCRWREKTRRLCRRAYRFLHSDLFEKVEGTFDCIVSNPPYIASGDIPGLMEEVRDHEPHMALDGKEDGLFFYRKIIEEAKLYLKKHGWLCFEIGCDQAQAVSAMMKQNGYEHIRVIQDLAGLDRVVMGQTG